MKVHPTILTTAILGLACLTGTASEVSHIRIEGAIGPATADYLARAIKVAESRNAACLVIELDTPGGLLSSTEQIVKSLYASRVPTVVYVSPSGAMAGSAGCFITLAAEIAAMAPNTIIGAAHPVAIGAGGAEKMDDVMKEKAESAAASFIEGIAERRGRNVEWARASVIKSESLTAEKALDMNVIDVIAKDLPDLLKQIDGRKAESTQALKTAGAEVAGVPRLLREKFFQIVWRPEVMMILLLAAIYGIIGEVSNPGAILPGVVGAISLVLFLYMASVLPINIAGIALIVLAIGLFAADLFAPSHGVLTFGGIVSFFLGAMMLFNKADPSFRLPIGYVIPATLITAAFFIFVAGAGLKAQLNPVRTGKETMIGKVVEAIAPISESNGKVFIEGEYWNAVSPVPVAQGEMVEVTGVERLTLKVKPHKT